MVDTRSEGLKARFIGRSFVEAIQIPLKNADFGWVSNLDGTKRAYVRPLPNGTFYKAVAVGGASILFGIYVIAKGCFISGGDASMLAEVDALKQIDCLDK